MKPTSEPNKIKSKLASKPQNGLEIRTAVKAGDDVGGSGTYGSSTYLNHGLRVRRPSWRSGQS